MMTGEAEVKRSVNLPEIIEETASLTFDDAAFFIEKTVTGLLEEVMQRI